MRVAYCGLCPSDLSRAGRPVYRGVGLGAFADYVLVPATGAVRIAADVPLGITCGA